MQDSIDSKNSRDHAIYCTVLYVDKQPQLYVQHCTVLYGINRRIY